jgi:antitoxin MazE
MRMRVKKRGKNLSLRIPAPVLEAAALRAGQEVEIWEKDGRIFIDPAAVPAYDLDLLLAQMHPGNLHEDIDFGPPVGKEIW